MEHKRRSRNFGSTKSLVISLIVAMDRNRGIGFKGDLLCKISGDLKNFRKLTLNKTIVMGRKTFESIPNVLDNRKHIVLTKDDNYKVDHPDVDIFTDINRVLELSEEEIFVIGGGEIYNFFLPHANRLYLTTINDYFEADTYFPEINLDKWHYLERSELLLDEKTKLEYKIEVLQTAEL